MTLDSSRPSTPRSKSPARTSASSIPPPLTSRPLTVLARPSQQPMSPEPTTSTFRKAPPTRRYTFLLPYLSRTAPMTPRKARSPSPPSTSSTPQSRMESSGRAASSTTIPPATMSSFVALQKALEKSPTGSSFRAYSPDSHGDSPPNASSLRSVKRRRTRQNQPSTPSSHVSSRSPTSPLVSWHHRPP